MELVDVSARRLQREQQLVIGHGELERSGLYEALVKRADRLGLAQGHLVAALGVVERQEANVERLLQRQLLEQVVVSGGVFASDRSHAVQFALEGLGRVRGENARVLLVVRIEDVAAADHLGVAIVDKEELVDVARLAAVGHLAAVPGLIAARSAEHDVVARRHVLLIARAQLVRVERVRLVGHYLLTHALHLGLYGGHARLLEHVERVDAARVHIEQLLLLSAANGGRLLRQRGGLEANERRTRGLPLEQALALDLSGDGQPLLLLVYDLVEALGALVVHLDAEVELVLVVVAVGQLLAAHLTQHSQLEGVVVGDEVRLEHGRQIGLVQLVERDALEATAATRRRVGCGCDENGREDGARHVIELLVERHNARLVVASAAVLLVQAHLVAVVDEHGAQRVVRRVGYSLDARPIPAVLRQDGAVDARRVLASRQIRRLC